MTIAEPFAGRRILITGGLGFIGSTLAARLVEAGADVNVVDSLVPQYGGNRFNIAGIEDKVHVNVSDVRDQYSMKSLVQGMDYLFNLAGQTSHLDSMEDPYTDLDINCKAQLSILEACRTNNPDLKVVFASTRQIYGRPDYLPVDEKHMLRPVDVNGINKIAGEAYHILYSNVHGIRSTALRLTNTYGPRMRIKDARQTFLGVWIRLVLEGKPFEIWEGEQLRDFTYVDDAVDAFMLAAATEDTNGHVYNIGGDEVISLADLGALLVKVRGSGRFEVRSFPPERKRIDIGDYYGDYSLFARTAGWAPKVGLELGLAETLAFFEQNLNQYL